MKIKAHSRKWKAWARRMAQFCQREACWIDHVCLWAKMHGCCPQHAPKVFGGWKYACRAVEEGQWTLLADCSRALRQRAVRGRAWDEACMDLSMAREALETAGWWLRKCAEDMEALDEPDRDK